MNIDYFKYERIFINIVLCIYVISIPFKDVFFQSSIVLLILSFFVIVFRENDFLDFIKKIKILLYFFVAILFSMTISNLSNDFSWLMDSLKIQFSYFYRYMLIILVLLYFFEKKIFSKNFFLIYLLISLLVQGIDGIFQSLEGYDYFKQIKGNLIIGLTGVTFNRNAFGFLMGIGVILSLYFFNINDLYKKYIGIITISIFIFCTIFSYSRAVWVSLCIVLFIYLFINFRVINKKIFFFFSFIFIFIFILFFSIDTLNNRLTSLFMMNSSNRDTIWLFTINLIEEKPFLGWGLASWSFIGLKNYSSVHNSLLEIILILGLFGFVIYFVFFVFLMREILYFKDFKSLYILIFFIVVSLFDQNVFTGKIFLSCFSLLIFNIFSNRLKVL